MTAIRFVVAASILLTSSACSYFAPAYVLDADKKATEGYEVLSVMLAKAELGAFSESSSYRGQVDNYATIVSKFTVAKLAFGPSGSGSSNSRVNAASSLDTLINNCIRLVELFAREHESDGVLPGTGMTQPVQVGCDAAVKALRATR